MGPSLRGLSGFTKHKSMRQIQLEVSYRRNVIDGIKCGDVDASKWWLERYHLVGDVVDVLPF